MGLLEHIYTGILTAIVLSGVSMLLLVLVYDLLFSNGYMPLAMIFFIIMTGSIFGVLTFYTEKENITEKENKQCQQHQ